MFGGQEELSGRVWESLGAAGSFGGASGGLGLPLGISGVCKATADPLQVAGEMTVESEACVSHHQCPVLLMAAVSVVQ